MIDLEMLSELPRAVQDFLTDGSILKVVTRKDPPAGLRIAPLLQLSYDRPLSCLVPRQQPGPARYGASDRRATDADWLQDWWASGRGLRARVGPK